jgi:DNA-binding MarR family transcriptional regulator
MHLRVLVSNGLIRTVRWEQDFRQQNLVTLEIGHRHNAQETITRIRSQELKRLKVGHLPENLKY